MNQLNMKDIAIIDAFPVLGSPRNVLNVGCGPGRIDYHLSKMNYLVHAIDIKQYDTWQNNERLSFAVANIFDLQSIPVQSAQIVICSQVLEHISDFRKALANLLSLAEIRLIITVPYKNSFSHPEHVNFWDDNSIKEFNQLCKPHPVSISKIITKIEDKKTGQRNYLISVDKREE